MKVREVRDDDGQNIDAVVKLCDDVPELYSGKPLSIIFNEHDEPVGLTDGCTATYVPGVIV